MFLYKKIAVLLILILMIITFSGCTKVDDKEEVTKIKVAVSINPLAEFTKAIAGDKVQVYTIIPNGTEPHDFELKAVDLKQLSMVKVFIYNGLGMEPWVDKALSSINNTDLIKVDTSKDCNLIENIDEATIEEHGKYDPHIWLSLKNAKIQSYNIKEALIKADPSNKDYYEENYLNFTKELDKLYVDFKSKFEGLNNKNFVTGHSAFAYLCKDFGLKQSSVENVFSEGEPTAKKLQELVEYCRANNVNTVFMEELASPKVSQTLAKEINGSIKEIYTIESSKDDKDYIQDMKENLQLIYESLK